MPRPRKPLAEKKLTGRRAGRDSGGRKLPDEPEYDGSLPPSPKGLKAEGLTEWGRLGPKMVERGVLTEGDWMVFTQYCECVQRHFEVERAQRKVTIGTEEWHKLDRARDRNEKQLTKAMTELGLTPQSRSKVSLQRGEKADPVGRFKRGLALVKGAKK